MKIRTIAITNHPGIGDLTLNFARDEDGSVYDTIILAGANGTGKSSILEMIASTLDGDGVPPGCKIDLVMQLNEEEVTPIFIAATGAEPSTPGPKQLILSMTGPEAGDYSPITVIFKPRIGGLPPSVNFSLAAESLRHLPRYYSQAENAFNPSDVISTTAQALDTPKRRTVRSNQGTDVAQLLVDVRAQDNEDAMREMEAGAPAKPRRQDRFRRAFETFLPSKRWVGINLSNSPITVEFEEFGRRADIRQLSTGEKQIIARATFLLRDLHLLNDALVLIDEPELSLHPAWQQRVLPFYETLLTSDTQTRPQLIVATHSPFIVHGAPHAKTIILERDPVSGRVSPMQHPSYPGFTNNLSVIAFDLHDYMRISSKKPLILVVEGPTDARIIKNAWQKLRGTAEPFDVEIAFNDKGINAILSGSSHYKQLADTKFLGIYDFDEAYNQWSGLWRNKVPALGSESEGLIKKHPEGLAGAALILPVPEWRSGLASQSFAAGSRMPIEFMFRDKDIPADMWTMKPTAGGGQVPHFYDGRKTEFANLTAGFEATAFSAFEPLLLRIEAFISGEI